VPPQDYPSSFYRTLGGAEVVRDWLRPPSRGLDLMRVHTVGPLVCRFAGRWGDAVVRTSLPSNRIARVLLSAAGPLSRVQHRPAGRSGALDDAPDRMPTSASESGCSAATWRTTSRSAQRPGTAAYQRANGY